MLRSIVAIALSVLSISCQAQLRERPPITNFSVAQLEPDNRFVLCENCLARTSKRAVTATATQAGSAEVLQLRSIGKRNGAP